jgi:hypothetical protein
MEIELFKTFSLLVETVGSVSLQFICEILDIRDALLFIATQSFFYKDEMNLATDFYIPMTLIQNQEGPRFEPQVKAELKNDIHTYHSRFIPEGVSQIFLRDTHVLQKLLSYEEHCKRDMW